MLLLGGPTLQRFWLRFCLLYITLTDLDEEFRMEKIVILGTLDCSHGHEWN